MEDLILPGFFGAEGNYGPLLGLNYGLNEATVMTYESLYIFCMFLWFFFNIFLLFLK
jgi:hypothetical protein